MVGTPRGAVAVERAVGVPVPVHLGERPDVDRLAEGRDRLVQGDEHRVACTARNLTGGDRLGTTAFTPAGTDPEHRHVAHRGEEAREVLRRLTLRPAHDHEPKARVLGRLLVEAVRVAEHAQEDVAARRARRRRRRRLERDRRGCAERERRQQHAPSPTRARFDHRHRSSHSLRRRSIAGRANQNRPNDRRAPGRAGQREAAAKRLDTIGKAAQTTLERRAPSPVVLDLELRLVSGDT